MFLAMGPTIRQDTVHRSLPYGLKDIVGELELRGAMLVSAEEIAAYGSVAPHTPAAYDLVHRLVAARWLRPLPVRGRYEFLPGRAGPFSREDTLDPLRVLLEEHGLGAQVVLAGAAFLRGFADRAPLAFDVLVPRNRRISTSLRSLYRFHWVAPDRIFGAEPLEGLPVSTCERLLLDVALWPNVVGGGIRARDHWLGSVLETAATDRVVEMLQRLDSATVTARAGYLAGAFGRPDLADAIADLGRSRIAVPLLPGAESTPATRHDRRFNVVDPVGAATVA
jgi:predicted transcriptional regulator of viral defense system